MLSASWLPWSEQPLAPQGLLPRYSPYPLQVPGNGTSLIARQKCLKYNKKNSSPSESFQVSDKNYNLVDQANVKHVLTR